ncbi:peptide chain release factor 2 [Iamia majanohamensis]|uniref:Peptide chain release factor 2 n=1 Tax=Iamia majanohamensis TaxID=467976 RepID=A0AAE9Y3S6_9ACTN|nr:peptide chain release factor 2 [Iamia majanohamensis]WCO65569.1 peptide chain release factor 2 [Iamia majanohamensis]
MRDFSDDLAALRTSLAEARQYLRIDDLRDRRPQLETEASRPDLWDDADRGRAVTGELSSVVEDLERYDGLEERISDAETLAELAREEGDESLEPEVEEAIASVRSEFRALELRSLFTGPHDEADAICELQSGEGGADAQDWTNMLLRMYLRWAERRGFATELDEVSEGSEAGISSAQFLVKGRHAYGLLRSEHGVHRLVRMSPFNAQGKRQTAFAALKVTPFLEDIPDVEIDEKDLRIDVYRSSGAGGQHVNVTDSAVRITHEPTGIVVSCQNERSQHQNKDRAMQVLRAKLAEREREKREEELAAIRGEQRSVGFGSQIRSYVMQPYQMVKDLRTEHETGQVDAVLDGDLDGLMEAFLRWRRAEETA